VKRLHVEAQAANTEPNAGHLAIAALEKILQERKAAKEGVLGAVWRLAQTRGWKSPADMAELLRAELIHQRGGAREGTYAFKHALIQEAAYSTLVSARRQQLHAQCAAILRELSPEMEEQQPELLAHHYTGAGSTEEAITYWLKAGRRAAERSANVEAVAHLRHGLRLVPALADPARRDEVELRLQLEMGGPLIATEGYAAPATLAAWERARALAEQCGEHRQLARTLYGLWAARQSLGETRTALALADRILEIGAQIRDEGVRIVGHRVRALTMHVLGEYAAARARPSLERVVVHARSADLLPPSHPAGGQIQVTKGEPRAFVCVGETCSLPVSDPADLLRIIESVQHR